MAGSRKIHRYQIDLTSGLLYLLIYCVTAVVITYVYGADVMYYTWFPALTAAALDAFSIFCTESFIEEEIKKRVLRRRIQNALVVYRGVLLICLLQAGILILLFVALSDRLAGRLLQNALISPVLRCYVPLMVMSCFNGCLTGFVRGTGDKRRARMGLWLRAALSLLLGTGGGVYGFQQGEKAAALLQKEGLDAVYCGCGIAAGFGAASFVSLAAMWILCRLDRGRLMQEQSRREAFLADAERTETEGALARYYVQKSICGLAALILMMTGMVLSYRLWLSGQGAEQGDITISLWGGYMGVGFPILFGLGLFTALPFTQQTAQLVKTQEKGKRRAAHIRLSRLLRLSAYTGLPWSGYLFSAAGIIAAIFPHLTFTAQDSAEGTLRSGSLCVWLLQTTVLMLYYFWSTHNRRQILQAAAAALAAQAAVLLMSEHLGGGMQAAAAAMSLFWLTFFSCMYLSGKRRILRGMHADWVYEDLRILLCAVLAAVPVFLTADYLLEAVSAGGALIISSVLYLAVYVLLSVVLRAADLRGVRAVPGGGLVISLAVLMGVAGEEDE